MTDVRSLLHDAWTRACTRFAGVELDFDAFVEHATRVIPAGASPESIARLHLEDLYIAAGCTRGDGAAVRWFETHALPGADPALRSLDGNPAFADEVRQRVRTKLLVPSGATPARIAEYAARGALTSWVTVAAVRTALSLLRETKRAEKYAGDEWAEALVLPDVGDVEVDYLKQRYRQEFSAGLADACARLPARDRTILRLHFMDGLNIDQIGQIYGVHRATVARWIAKSRTALLEGTRQFLAEHLSVAPSEFSSLDRLVRSQLDVSLGELLGPEELE